MATPCRVALAVTVAPWLARWLLRAEADVTSGAQPLALYLSVWEEGNPNRWAVSLFSWTWSLGLEVPVVRIRVER